MGGPGQSADVRALGALARARLWLSYQRYALALIGVPLAVVLVAAVCAPWWAAVLAAIAALVPARFGIEVLGRWPRKLRATQVAMARVRAGTFTPVTIRGYCGDPCYRVVAREVLTRAGVPYRQRRALIRRFADELRRESNVVVVIDHMRGAAITIGGGAQERT